MIKEKDLGDLKIEATPTFFMTCLETEDEPNLDYYEPRFVLKSARLPPTNWNIDRRMPMTSRAFREEKPKTSAGSNRLQSSKTQSPSLGELMRKLRLNTATIGRKDSTNQMTPDRSSRRFQSPGMRTIRSTSEFNLFRSSLLSSRRTHSRHIV
eukprot:TRINITY_DN8563_c0_g1_i4.p1 TRINITY_DN8563_c0_g1~~TRINITY_DN8563_c0_g1_i4.p1  ORF type:complete len:153 (-),score=20.86 TRINITY_DN8563_c0_g1_i4:141-599(-)